MPLSYRSIAATIRPKGGVDNKVEARFIAYAKKQQYALVVAEKEGHERHLHMQFWWDTPREIGTISRAMERNQAAVDEQWDGKSKFVCRNGVEHCYNDDWMNKYLSPDNPDKVKDKYELLYKVIPKDTRPFYPSQEDQDKAFVIKHAKDKQFAKLALEFSEWYSKPENVKKTKHQDEIYDESPGHWDVARFLSYRMFDARDMYVLKGKKQKMELCQSLYFYITGSTSESIKSFMCAKSATKEQDACGYET